MQHERWGEKMYSASGNNGYNTQKLGVGSIIQKIHFSEAETQE